MALITPAQFRIGFPQLTGTAADDDIAEVISWADGLLALFIGLPVPDSGARTLEDTQYTRRLDGPLTSDPLFMSLGLRPVVSLTSVHVDPNRRFTDDTEADLDDLELHGADGLVSFYPDTSGAWSSVKRANKVVCVAGFSTTPGDLAALTVATVRHLWDRRGNAGRTARTAQQQSETYAEAAKLIPAEVRELIAPYILWESRVG